MKNILVIVLFGLNCVCVLCENRTTTNCFGQGFSICRNWSNNCRAFPNPIKYSDKSKRLGHKNQNDRFQETGLDQTTVVNLQCTNAQYAQITSIWYFLPKTVDLLQYNDQTCRKMCPTQKGNKYCKTVSCCSMPQKVLEREANMTLYREYRSKCQNKPGSCQFPVSIFRIGAGRTQTGYNCDSNGRFPFYQGGYGMCLYAVWVQVNYTCISIGKTIRYMYL